MNKKAIAAGRRLLPVYQEVDQKIASYDLAERSSCKRGCNHCCHLLVAVSLLEAVPLAEFLLQTHPWKDQLPELKKKLREQADRIDSLGGIAKGEAVSFPYLQSRTPCVFLKKNGDCGVYRIRPFTCRTYFVVSPPEDCDPGRPKAQVQGFDTRPLIFEGWSQVFGEKEAVPNLADSLQRMVLIALELLERKPAEFKRWLEITPHHVLPGPDILMNQSFLDALTTH